LHHLIFLRQQRCYIDKGALKCFFSLKMQNENENILANIALKRICALQNRIIVDKIVADDIVMFMQCVYFQLFMYCQKSNCDKIALVAYFLNNGALKKLFLHGCF